MTDPINIFVAGLGRCGTTAMMQLLWNGGAPVSGPAPAFEDERLSPAGIDLPWVKAQRGKILKWVDPVKNKLPAGIPAKTILMLRDPKQQARSQIKMLRTIGNNDVPDNRRAQRRWAHTLRRDTPIMVAGLRKRGPVLCVGFADLLGHPLETAELVQDFLGPSMLPDPVTGAEAILKRGPECAPDMWIEQSAIIAWQTRVGA